MKTFVSLALTLGGICLFLWPLQIPGFPLDVRLITWALPLFIVLLGMFVLAYKPEPALIRFGPLTWTIGEITRHVLITGDTGVGKTSSGFAPLLVQISQSIRNWGGLVLGVKGDEWIFAKELCEGQGRSASFINVTVRPESESTKWKPPHRYNLVSDRSLPWTTHAKAIVDTAAALTSGQQSSFFKPAAQQALANAFTVLDDIGEPVTLRTAFDFLTDSETMERKLNELAERSPTDDRIRVATYFDQTFMNVKAQEQKEGIVGTIKVFLAFFQDPDIAAVFCSNEPNTFEISDVDHGMILSVAMPQRFSTERRYVNTYLKTLFYYHALRRFDKKPEDRKDENLLLGVFDEFQGLVTASEDGLADHNILDRIRSAKVAVIAGMQSEISADPVIGKEKRKVLALNMRTRFIFRAGDSEGAGAAADHIGKKKWKKRSRSTKGALFGGGVTISTSEQWDYKIQPAELSELKDHTAVIVHPSKKHFKMRIPPVGGDGKVRSWYK